MTLTTLLSGNKCNPIWLFESELHDVLFKNVPYIGPQTLMILWADEICRVVFEQSFVVGWATQEAVNTTLER